MRMPNATPQQALEHAELNATRSGKAWIVFFDTTGCPNVEVYQPTMECHKTGLVVHPVTKTGDAS